MEFRFQQFVKKDQELEKIRDSHPYATFTVDHNIFSDRTDEEMARKWNKNYMTPLLHDEAIYQPQTDAQEKKVRNRIRSGFGDKNWCDKYCNEIQD